MNAEYQERSGNSKKDTFEPKEPKLPSDKADPQHSQPHDLQHNIKGDPPKTRPEDYHPEKELQEKSHMNDKGPQIGEPKLPQNVQQI